VRFLLLGLGSTDLDLPGGDTATARYAMAIADTIVTDRLLVSYAISGLAQTHPATHKMLASGKVRPMEGKQPRTPMSKDASAAYCNSMTLHKSGAREDI
jgi:hypothetical protein